MNTKAPALLIVLIEARVLRWSVAGIDESDGLIPLVQSQSGDLSGPAEATFDERVSFLRHRLAGAVQRGCDRLWGRKLKPVQLIFVQFGSYADTPEELTLRVAEHFCEWMVNPQAAFCTRPADSDGELATLAGDITAAHLATVHKVLPELKTRAAAPSHWEICPTRGT